MSRESKSLGFSIAVFAVIGAVVLLIMSAMTGILKGNQDADMSPEAVAARIQPIGRLNTGAPIVASAEPAKATEPTQVGSTADAKPAATSSSDRSGEDIYKKICIACHASGATGAPIVGNKEAWAPRIQQGVDTLVDHAVHGFKAMPPRGTCTDCSDAELRKTVKFMVSKSG